MKKIYTIKLEAEQFWPETKPRNKNITEILIGQADHIGGQKLFGFTCNGRKIQPGDYIVYFKDGVQIWDQEDFEKLLDSTK